MAAAGFPRGQTLLGHACQLLPVLAWCLLLWGSLVPQARWVDPPLALCLVTVLSAAGCWARVAVADQRAAWSWLALALSGYAAGFVVLFGISMGEGGGPGGLNYSDCFSLLLYPAAYTGLLLLTRSRVRSWAAASLLDGGIVALAASAVALTWAAATYPTLLVGSPLAIVYALAYPVGGATLLVVTLTGLAMTRWQLDAVWGLLVLGFAVMTVGDALYGITSAAGTFRFGTPVDAAFTAGPVLVCLAAWRRPRHTGRRAGNARVAMLVPAGSTLVALLLLVTDHYRRIPTLAVALAAAAVLLAIGRTWLSWRQERQLADSRRQALTDELTGLQNRRALLQSLRQALTLPATQPHLLLVDLDGFKQINDTLGHPAGDQLLVETADRLRSVAGERIARLGGDEFAVVLTSAQGDPRALAAKIQDALTAPVEVEGYRVSVGVSLGLAHAGPGATGGPPASGELLRRADVALYRAKRRRTGVESWTDEMDAGARDRLLLLTDLRAALSAGDQIVVHHQVQVDAGTGQVRSTEALLRWQHPRRGLLTPGDFLEAAEQAGLLPELTARVLDLVLSGQRRRAAAGAAVLPVSVNVGAPDLLDPEFAQAVADRLAAAGLPASCLRLEVTEGVVMSDPDRILTTLHQLQAFGVSLALDDYGTGLSSLGYLRLLPVDELKVDRSFVARTTTDRASALIVASTISLAHGLGLRVVAEGVEDADTLEGLRLAGCDLVQGYLTGRPAPADDLLDALLPAPRTAPTGPDVLPAQPPASQPSSR